MPEVLDISHLRSTGKQPDEEELADTAPADAPGVLSIVLHFRCYAILLSCKGSLCVAEICRDYCQFNVPYCGTTNVRYYYIFLVEMEAS